MMPETLGGCVGPSLRVYGIQKLSIVDAAILPMIPAATIQGTMYVIGEKAADLIKARAKREKVSTLYIILIQRLLHDCMPMALSF